MLGGDLQVVLRLHRLMAGGGLSILPLGGFQQGAELRGLVGGQDVGDANNHRRSKGDEMRLDLNRSALQAQSRPGGANVAVG